MFHQAIWMEHDREAAAHEEPVTQIRQELFTMQANLETLRTRTVISVMLKAYAQNNECYRPG